MNFGLKVYMSEAAWEKLDT